jgi:hypothetical protein
MSAAALLQKFKGDSAAARIERVVGELQRELPGRVSTGLAVREQQGRDARGAGPASEGG